MDPPDAGAAAVGTIFDHVFQGFYIQHLRQISIDSCQRHERSWNLKISWNLDLSTGSRSGTLVLEVQLY
jgi:hypothetical protein